MSLNIARTVLSLRSLIYVQCFDVKMMLTIISPAGHSSFSGVSHKVQASIAASFSSFALCHPMAQSVVAREDTYDFSSFSCVLPSQQLALNS